MILIQFTEQEKNGKSTQELLEWDKRRRQVAATLGEVKSARCGVGCFYVIPPQGTTTDRKTEIRDIILSVR